MCESRRPTEGADSAPIEHDGGHGVGGDLRTIGRLSGDLSRSKVVVHETPAVSRLYRVRVMDIEGPAWYIEVHAIGRHDAREQARAKAVEQGAERPGVLAIEEVAA